MYICLLIQTLQYEQKHIIHESLLQTWNSPVSQLLLCPEWLRCHYKCHSKLMLENLHVRFSILAGFFLYGMDIRSSGIFLLHISGSVDYWIHFLCITCSINHYHHLHWGREVWSTCCCLSKILYTCMLPLLFNLCLPIWLYAKGNMWLLHFIIIIISARPRSAEYKTGIYFETAKNTKAFECFFAGFQYSLWKFNATGYLYSLKSWPWLAAVACIVCNWNYWYKHRVLW